MGCGASKLVCDKQMSANSQWFLEKIEKIKQRRRVRSASIVSKTELLSDREGDADNSVEKAVEEIVMVVIEKKKKEQMNGAIIKRDEREDEFPGSPSFRVYCREVASTKELENDPIKVVEKMEEEKQEKERILVQTTYGRENSSDSLISNEDSVRKPHKKEKGRRRVRALTKAPSRVYSFLSVKNCYGPSSTTDTAPDDCPRPRLHSLKSA